MNPTQELLKRDPKLRLHNEGEWSGRQLLYSAFNDAGLECEVGELLFGFVRALKPLRVLETGTHVAIGASYLGLALECNSRGILDTLEFDPTIYTQAKSRIRRVGLAERVNLHLIDAKNFTPQEPYQFILLDTEPQTRFAEMVKFWPYLDIGGYLFIHDLHSHMGQVGETEHGLHWPYGEILKKMQELMDTGEATKFHFPTPRGLTGFYKNG